ncbi:integrase, catalytic region, zinc finger, CCHC-type containing protein [Tanacetum coccineum]
MMANISEDIQCASSDTRPPILDRTDFESWQQHIRLYCPRKDNGVNILKSIDEGPFKMGKFRETLAEGALHRGPERDRVFADLTPEEKERFKADIRATNILLQGSELTKDECESQLYDDFEHFRQNKGETIYEYYVRFTKLINDMRNIKMTMPKMQLNSKFVNSMLPEWGRFMTAIQDLALNEDNVFQVDQCDAFDFDVDEAPTSQTMFMANLSSVDPIYDEAGSSYDLDILFEVVQIVLWYFDSGCSKHMMGNHSRIKNFVKKFIGTVRFGNDHFGAIMGYGDYVIGDRMISTIYYVEELGHNLFSVGQFSDSDLEVAFRKHSCYVKNEDGMDLLKGSRGLNLYTISVEHDEVLSNLLITQSLQEQIMVVASLIKPFELRVTWVKFLRSKDETPEFVIKFLKQIQVGLNKTVRYIRTDNGTKFVNQNGVVERQNRTLVEAAQIMLIFSKAPMFLCAEVVATACYTQNRPLIHTNHNKTRDQNELCCMIRKPDQNFSEFLVLIDSPTKTTEQMAPVHINTGPKPILLTSGQISSGLVPNPIPAAPYVPPTNKDLEILFPPMLDEYLEPPSVERPVPPAPIVQVPVVSVGMPSSTTIDQDALSTSHSPSSSEV